MICRFTLIGEGLRVGGERASLHLSQRPILLELKKRNAKISALRSLVDICFLHVLTRLIRCVIVSVCPTVF